MNVIVKLDGPNEKYCGECEWWTVAECTLLGNAFLEADDIDVLRCRACLDASARFDVLERLRVSVKKLLLAWPDDNKPEGGNIPHYILEDVRAALAATNGEASK